VSLTTTATLLSPLVVPFTLTLALGKTVHFEQSQASLWLVATVVGPVVVGHLLGRIFTTYTPFAQRVGKAIANLTILWIIAVVVGINRDRLAQIDGQLVAALLGLNLLGYLAGDLGARAMRISPAMRRALTIEVGMQNAGLGTTMVLTLFKDLPDYQRAAIPTALYTFGCMFTGTLLARWWAGRSLPSAEESAPEPSY
jgi:BASS family bile acid:Na+ symporter